MDLARVVCLALVAGHTAACADAVFACAQDSDCAGAGAAGTCEASGFCSFPDDDCPSGARYGGHAGDALAGDCVDEDAEGSSSSGTPPGTSITTTYDPSAADTLTTSDDGSSGALDDGGSSSDDAGPRSECGDRHVDDGEDCDDGNVVDADGCNTDCTASGALVWSVIDYGAPGDGAESIALLPDGTVVVGAGIGTDDGRHVLQAQALSADGAPVWSQSYDTTPLVASERARAWGLAIADDGAIAIGGTLEGGDAPRWAVHGLLAVDGSLAWTLDGAGSCDELRFDDDGQVWALGEDAGAARILVLDAGAQVGELPASWFPDTALPRDLALVGGGWVSVGVLDGPVVDTGYAATSAVDSLAPINPGTSYSLANALVPQGDAFVVVGAISEGLPMGEAQGDGWIGRYDGADATAEVVLAEAGLDALHDVAIAPDGDVIAVGWHGPDGDDPRIVAMRFDSELALRWTSSITAGNGGSDRAHAVVIGAHGEIFVAGTADVGPTSTPWIARLAP